MTKAQIGFACNWDTQSVLEWGRVESSANVGGASDKLRVEAKPSGVPAAVSPFGMVVEPSGSGLANIVRAWADNFGAETNAGAESDGGAGMWVKLVTAPSGGTASMLNWYTAGDSYSLGWHTDGTIRVMDSLQSVSYITSASTYSAGDVVYLHFRWSESGKWVKLRIYDSSVSLSEDLYGHTGTALSVSDCYIGQFSGTLTAGEVWISELYEMAGGGMWPPLNPTFVTAFPDSVALNATEVVLGDTGVDDDTTEHTYLDEAPPVDTSDSYVKMGDQGFSGIVQTYGSGGGLVSAGDNVLAVGLTNRFLQEPNGTVQHQCVLRLGTSLETGPGDSINETGATQRKDNVWGYQRGFFDRIDPDGNEWTIANANSVEFGHRWLNFSGDGVRCSQSMIYVIHGDDSELDDDRTIVRGGQVI